MAIHINKRGGYIAKDDLAAQAGGLPPKDAMNQGGAKPTRVKAGWSFGFNCLNPRTSEKTSKADGNLEEIRKRWRKHDLPPRNLQAFSENNLKMAEARTAQRIAGAEGAAEPDAKLQTIAQCGLDQVLDLQATVHSRSAALNRLREVHEFAERMLSIDVGTVKLVDGELAELGTKLDGVRALITAQRATVAKAESSMRALHPDSLGRMLGGELIRKTKEAIVGLEAQVRAMTTELAAVRAMRQQMSLQVTDKTAHVDRVTAQIAKESGELAGLESQLASAQATYARVRKETVHAALTQFFDAYSSLREHGDDKARMTAMERVLPRFADALELPAKYLAGLSAREKADAMVDAYARHKAGPLDKLDKVLELMQGTLAQAISQDPDGVGQDIGNLAAAIAEEKLAHQATFDRAKADIGDALVGRHARLLTAGRMSELVDPPQAPEAEQWSADSAKLRTLAEGYSAQARLIAETLPAQMERATRLQEQAMQTLVTHLPHLDRIASPALREQTLAALGKVARNLVQAAPAGSLAKDAVLPPMQLVHIVEMANAVTGGDAERSLRLYERLTDTSVKDALRQRAERVAEPTGTERDLVNLWQMSAHQLPYAVTSLIAANRPGNMRADQSATVSWRSVQSFWRCAQEQESLGTTDAEAAHKVRLGHAMRGLSAELADGQPPAAGTLERRYATMARSAVWQLETVQGIDAMMGRIVQPGPLLSASEVATVHDLFGAKGRGLPVEDARAEFKRTLEQLGTAARDWLAHPDPAGAEPGQQMAAASLLLGLTDYLQAHRGSEKTHTRIKRMFTRKKGTFNSGKEIWTNDLGPKEKQRILELAERHLARATGGAGPGVASRAGEAFARLRHLQARHGALELLQEAVEAKTALAPRRTDAIHGADGLHILMNRVAVAKGGPLDTPDAVRHFLHDAIDRTELGDRMDIVSAHQDRLQVPIRIPAGPGAVMLTPGAHFSKGVIINVQANNDSVQLTLGKTTEWSVGGAAGYQGSVESADDHEGRKLSGPGVTVRYDYKNRVDPAVVIKCPIAPDKGLRDLADARQRLKDAVDILVAWPTMQDGKGQPYSSAFEAMADRLDSLPTIDWERRDYIGHAGEAALSAGLSVELGIKNLILGAAVTGKAGKTHDVMISSNQQGAQEKYVTDKQYAKVEGFLGVGTKATGTRADGAVTGNTHAGVAMNFGVGGFVAANIGGQETKDKFPVGDDRQKAYKQESGLFGRDMEAARDLVFATLPQVARRVQDVCKGVGLDAELATLMEAEVLMNFARMLDEDKTDRFSTKAESSQQFSLRGLDAGIATARSAGDDAMADLLTQVKEGVTAGNKDQAVKYFVAAGELSAKRTSWFGKRTEVKSMREDPVPDTRTATLFPTADRLRQERQRNESLTGWQARIVQSALAHRQPPRDDPGTAPTMQGPQASGKDIPVAKPMTPGGKTPDAPSLLQPGRRTYPLPTPEALGIPPSQEGRQPLTGYPRPTPAAPPITRTPLQGSIADRLLQEQQRTEGLAGRPARSVQSVLAPRQIPRDALATALPLPLPRPQVSGGDIPVAKLSTPEGETRNAPSLLKPGRRIHPLPTSDAPGVSPSQEGTQPSTWHPLPRPTARSLIHTPLQRSTTDRLPQERQRAERLAGRQARSVQPVLPPVPISRNPSAAALPLRGPQASGRTTSVRPQGTGPVVPKGKTPNAPSGLNPGRPAYPLPRPGARPPVPPGVRSPEPPQPLPGERGEIDAHASVLDPAHLQRR
jgi:hypothetical protein